MKNPRTRVTLKDVADRLGLSTATVSLVLNQSQGADAIPPETQDRVFAMADELDYRPDHIARALRNRRTQSIGVLVPEIDEPYAAGVMSGLEAYLTDQGYFYLVASHHSKPERVDTYVGLLESRSVDGLVLLATSLSDPPPLPTIVVSGHQELEGVTNVVIDHSAAARLALEHLVELRHHRIALMKGQAENTDTDERWTAIQAAATSFGIEIGSDLVFQLEDDPSGERTRTEKSYRDGYRCGIAILETGRPVTALFAFNDVSAIGAMRAFAEAGLRVPEDVSVIGFDDIASAAFHSPALTTVRQPLREMGATAARILLARINDGETFPSSVTLSPELIVRGTTGPASSEPR